MHFTLTRGKFVTRKKWGYYNTSDQNKAIDSNRTLLRYLFTLVSYLECMPYSCSLNSVTAVVVWKQNIHQVTQEEITFKLSSVFTGTYVLSMKL